MMPPPSLTFKIVLLGEGRVGKTSLVLRYVNNVFSESQMATIQASYMTKRIVLEGQTPVVLAIWDTAGQERFHALGPIYYRDADAALLVYDIMDKDSFERVRMWVKELKKMGDSNIVLSIAANKSDKDRQRQVNLEESEQYAASIGAKHFVTSAKLNQGIEEAFIDTAQRIFGKKKEQMLAKSLSGSVPYHARKAGVVIVDDPYSTNRSAPQSAACCS